jgi:parallel beta-helix repeat protein
VSGTCNENVFIGEDKDRITLDGQSSATIVGLLANINTTPTIQVRGSGIVIKNFSSITGGRDGLLVNMGGAAVILNNNIHTNNRHGVNVNESSTARIGFQSVNDFAPSPNTIHDNGGRGVSVNGSSNARIAGNTINNNGDDGVGIFSVSHADVAKNLINGNGTGGSGGDGIAVGQNSGVNLGSDTTVTFLDEPNTTTVNNGVGAGGGFGIRCFINSYADGRQGTLNPLNGVSGATSFGASCSISLIP